MNADLAIELLIQLGIEAGKISAALAQAKAENRDISDEEWQQIIAENDAARTKLVAAIALAK